MRSRCGRSAPAPLGASTLLVPDRALARAAAERWLEPTKRRLFDIVNDCFPCAAQRAAMRCRHGIARNAEFRTVPDLRRITACCGASGTRGKGATYRPASRAQRSREDA